MTRRSRVATVFVGALTALAFAAAAQERATGAGLKKALEEYRSQTTAGAVDQDPQLNAVPRKDKAEATVVGKVASVGATEFADDGTPFRLVMIRCFRKPDTWEVAVVCFGSAWSASCGRLAKGTRVSITADVFGEVMLGDTLLPFDLLLVKRLQT